MVPSIRERYNTDFTQSKYQAFLDKIYQRFNHIPAFRIAESPIFIDRNLKSKLVEACEEISSQLCQPDFKRKTQAAIIPKYQVGGEDNHTLFLQMDFGICKEADGTLTPKLIEIQGFPSVYFFQDLLAYSYRKHFDIPGNYNHLFNGLDVESYRNLLRKNIVGDSHPENVILLEVLPEKQTTRIDFLCTEKHLGIPVKCISDLKKEGRNLYYVNEKGQKVAIEKIYNRIIFDELDHYPDLKREFYFKDEVEVKWVGHPNWFFRISKFTMPLLKSQYVPATRYLHEVNSLPDDLHNYVLKPLYSFAGTGVLINPNRFDINGIKEPENYILQKKVSYAPVIETPNEPAKCEIRMLMLWEPDAARPIILSNLVRLSKGEMIGVRYNKDKDWVGASIGFFRED